LVSSEINHGDGVYTTEIPEREVELGELEPVEFDTSVFIWRQLAELFRI
jgi:hypothetical protein